MAEVMMSSSRLGRVRAGEGAVGGSFQFSNGVFLVKVAGSQTEGKLAIFDTTRTARGGPPLHFHEVEDEWFQVVEGVFDFSVGGAEHRLMPGDSILGPVGIVHGFTNVTETGRLLLVFTPAGRMEAFFRNVGALGPISPQQFAQLSADYGMTVTGAPMPLRTA